MEGVQQGPAVEEAAACGQQTVVVVIWQAMEVYGIGTLWVWRTSDHVDIMSKGCKLPAQVAYVYTLSARKHAPFMEQHAYSHVVAPCLARLASTCS